MLKHQRGEIATALTLISIGLMLLGVVAGRVAVQQTNQLKSLAANSAVCPVSCPADNWSCVEEPYAAESCCADAAKQAQYNARYTNPVDAWKWDAGAGTCGGAKGIEKTSPPPATTTIIPPPFISVTPTISPQNKAACIAVGGTDCTIPKDCNHSYINTVDCGIGRVCCSSYGPKPTDIIGSTIVPTPTLTLNDARCIDKGGERCKFPTDCSTHAIPEGNCGSNMICCAVGSATNSICESSFNGQCVSNCPDSSKISDPYQLYCPAGTTCCKSSSNSTPNKQIGAGKYVVCSDAKTESGGICDSGPNGEEKFCYHECRPDQPGYSQPVWCSGKDGYVIKPIEKDPVCGETQGPAPSPGASCIDGKTTYTHGQAIPGKECVQVACDGLNWVQIRQVCLDGNIVNYPGAVIRSGDCSEPAPACLNGTPAPTQALVNPTKSPKPGGFHIGSEIYTYNRDNGVLFEFNLKFYFDGCDGDIAWEKNGNLIGTGTWRGSKPGDDFPVPPKFAASPIVGNGAIENVTYTGKFVNYHCLDGKNPTNMTDSITCRLAVDDKGNPRLSGTGCTWMNQGALSPVARATVTPGPTSNPNSVPVVNATPQVSGDCTYTVGNGNLTVKSTKNKGVTGVGIRVDEGTTIFNPAVAPSGDTWTFNTSSIGNGNHGVRFGWNCPDNSQLGCNNYCGGAIIISGSTVNGTPTPTGTNNLQCSLTSSYLDRSNAKTNQWIACADCISKKFKDKLDNKYPLTDPKYQWCSELARATEWCATTSDCFDQILKPGECGQTVKNGGCLDDKTNASPLKPQSYTNEGFQAFIDAKHDALDNSIYVTAATRAPGLQHISCDPFLNTAPGGCTFGSPASSQLQT